MSTIKFVLDTSVLLNFGVVGKLGLLLQFLGKDGIVTAWVYEEEVLHPRTRQALRAAVQRGDFEVVALESESELTLFGRLLADGALSDGEAETIAASVCRGWAAVIDDRAAVAEASKWLPADRLMDTHDVLRALVSKGFLSWTEAVRLNEAMRTAGRWLPPLA